MVATILGMADSAVVDAHDYDFWTYFDFETGTTKTLNVKSQEGVSLECIKVI